MSARAALAALAVIVGVATTAPAAVVIDSFDAPGEGLNDLAPASPVGGNDGTTLGGQRRAVLEAAAAIWSGVLGSPVPIHVAVAFDPLACNASTAILGSTGPNCFHFNFDGALVKRTWYPASLANFLHGSDLCDSADCETCFAADMTVQLNSTVGTTCPLPLVWYYGLDGNPPFGAVDFLTVVLHELAHGLGFLSLVNPSGAKLEDLDDAYMRFLEDHTTGKRYPDMTNAERAAASVATGDLHWVGPTTVAASGVLTDGVDPGTGHVEMYAPASFVPGSSVSHFTVAASPNELMEPSYTQPLFDVGLARWVLTDIGWALACGDGVVQPGEACDDGNRRDGDCCSSTCQLAFAGAPCTSADLCTVGGACDVGGTCVGGVAATCDDGNVCTDDACRPGTGCAHFTNDGPCDDGIACSSGDHCALGRCTGDWTCEPDGYQLYKTSRQSGAAKLPGQLVHLLDSFEHRWVRTSTTLGLARAAALAPDAPHVPAVSLECFKAKDRPIPSTPFAGRRVTVSHALGTATLDARKTAALCVAALTDPTAPPGDAIAHHVDHYRCYQAKTSPGSTPLAPQIVDVVDEYGTRPHTVGKPALYCNPTLVEQNGYLIDVIDDPDARLTCYQVKDAGGAPFERQNAFTRHRFGTEALRVVKSRLLCLPSTLVSIEPLP